MNSVELSGRKASVPEAFLLVDFESRVCFHFMKRPWREGLEAFWLP